jgi:hypothetical protein
MKKTCTNCYWFNKCEYSKVGEPACREYEGEEVSYERYPTTKQEVLVKALYESYKNLKDDYASAWSYVNSKIAKANL